MTISAESASAGFDASRLTLARLAAGLRKNELAERIEVSAGAVSQYEKGTTRPSPRVTAALALALGVPAEFFLADRPVEQALRSVPHFRSLRAASQMERDRAFAHATLAWELTEVLDGWVRFPEADLPSRFSLAPSDSVAAAEQVAESLRLEWGLGEEPVPNMVRLIEKQGVVVTRLPLGTSRVHAFSCGYPKRPVVVLAAERNKLAAGRLDAAHELGHLVCHDDAEPGHQVLERQAFAFGSAFLLPAKAAEDVLPRTLDFARLLQLKNTWGISVQALLFRSRSLGIMSDATYRRAMTRLSAFGWRRMEPGDEEVGEKPILLARALELVSERGVTLDEVATRARLTTDRVRMLACLDDQAPEVLGS